MYLESKFMERRTLHGKQFCNLCSRQGALGDIMDPEAELARFYMLIELNDTIDPSNIGESIFTEESNELKATFLWNI